jgi:hypothetical protein
MGGCEHRPEAVSTVAFTELPWMRRERADANIRRAIFELRALAREDEGWAVQYRSLADAFEAAIALLDAIEDTEDNFSRRVDGLS